MNQLEKLRVLLPHWIEHNRGHAEECRKWADQTEDNVVQSNLKEAFAAMEVVTEYLEKALDAAGGMKKDEDHGHHHHHH